jgi:ubiquinone/menaquinone biosynthesis C-methylase UbiE
MTHARHCIELLMGLTAASLYAAWQVYSRRSRERVVSQESLDDPDIVQAFNRISTLPQMRLLRWFVVRRAVALKKVGQAADLGSGPGHLAIKLAQAAPHLQVTGVDLSDAMLVQANEHARRSHFEDRVAFKKGDAAQIPLADRSLDLVVSTLSLHHWTDPVGVLDEVARVLRLGGSFLVFDLRRDMAAPFYLLLWFGTRYVMSSALRRANEPLGSRDAAFTPQEAPSWAIAPDPLACHPRTAVADHRRDCLSPGVFMKNHPFPIGLRRFRFESLPSRLQ